MTDMAYTVKLVSHIPAEDLKNLHGDLLSLIRQRLQAMFDEVFKGTSCSATVAWGEGKDSDNIVLHFVHDRASSYLVQKWGSDALKFSRLHAGGHTEPVRDKVGSEFYLWVPDPDKPNDPPNRFPGLAYSRLAFHESLHNQFPHRGGDIHGNFGGGGLAALHPHGDLPNARNIELMRQGLGSSVKIQQLL